MQVLPEDVASVASAVDVGVEKVVLTGSAETGCRVQSLLAESLTPATMELSGCDAVFVLESADLDRVARCLGFRSAIQWQRNMHCATSRVCAAIDASRARRKTCSNKCRVTP